MTKAETEIQDLLCQVWIRFCELSQEHDVGGHPDDKVDFKFHIHALENIIAARTGHAEYRGFLKEKTSGSKSV